MRYFRAQVVQIGDLSLGGDLPVRVQSMTNTDTLDTKSSVAQAIRIIEAGGELVRLTTQGIREAENLADIRKELRAAGFRTPLCADIHFNPAVAETAARLVEKVRINPGNYADKRASFIRNELSRAEYDAELERVRERLLPLIRICSEYGTAIRVGVNHGSLSDRIMTQYGNTPAGMAVSAIEFLRIITGEGFKNIVVSMKSSDTRVMVESNRLLVRMMNEEGMYFPVHLGITEAGEGDDGRIISAVGIGALLTEGIGDTVRVSLSEAPEKEIPVARELVRFTSGGSGRIKNPCTTPHTVLRDTRVIPEVYSDNDRIIRNEAGEIVTTELFTFPAEDLCPGMPDEKGYGILNPVFNENDHEKISIDAAALLGRFFLAGAAEGLCITNMGAVQGKALTDLSFSILQAAEARITRTRYVSCPTCGRTRFDLQAAVRDVKRATSHLQGMKIAVMGCIVNGPGEMAGSDYGYVGAGEGKVHIYRGTVPVLKNVPQEQALAKLLEIINEDQARR